jgi:hypothetical protein
MVRAAPQPIEKTVKKLRASRNMVLEPKMLANLA